MSLSPIDNRPSNAFDFENTTFVPLSEEDAATIDLEPIKKRIPDLVAAYLFPYLHELTVPPNTNEPGEMRSPFIEEEDEARPSLVRQLFAKKYNNAVLKKLEPEVFDEYVKQATKGLVRYFRHFKRGLVHLPRVTFGQYPEPQNGVAVDSPG